MWTPATGKYMCYKPEERSAVNSYSDDDTCTIGVDQLSALGERAEITDGIPLDRLREMCEAERESGCEYCSFPNKRLLVFELGEYADGTPAQMYIELSDYLLRAYTDDPTDATIASEPIRFCPVCGRMLTRSDAEAALSWNKEG